MKVVQWKVSYAQGHPRQTTPCASEMKKWILIKRPRQKRGRCQNGAMSILQREADHIVRAYSPITTASHSWLFNPLIAPGHTLFKNLLQRSHHSDSLDPSPLTTIALDRVEKQKTEQLLQSQEQSTIPRTRAQAWLNLTQRYRWRFVSVRYWCLSRMGIQEGRSRIVRPLLISLVPLMFPHVRNLLRVWGRILFRFPVDTAISEKTFCNTTTAFGCRDGQVIILDFTPLNLQEAVWFT